MKYSSENHNWDLSIMASSRLVTLGRSLDKKNYSFSAYTGGMVLAVTGLESFLNSMAYSVARNDSEFNYDEFEESTIEEKLDYFLAKFNVSIKKGKRPYQTVKKAIKWRNSLAHSKPTFIEETEITLGDDIRKIPLQHIATSNKYPPYENLVSEKNADRFNRDIIQIITEITKVSGINPRTQCTYNHK